MWRRMEDRSFMVVDSVCNAALMGGAKVEAWFHHLGWKNFFAASAEQCTVSY
jgi:hypothetical protein